MSEEFLTRRQLREREAAAAQQESEALPSRRELRDRERAIQERLDEAISTNAQPVKLPESSFPAQVISEPIVSNVEATQFLNEPQPFTDDSNPGTIPTQIIKREVSTETNSIILPTLPDITGSSFAVPQSNIVVRTGAIDLPQQQNPVTGEITLIVQPEPIVEVAEAKPELATETGKVGIIGIEPVPARSLPKKSKEQVFPGRLRKGWGVVYLVLGIALLMATLAAGIFFAYAYKLI